MWLWWLRFVYFTRSTSKMFAQTCVTISFSLKVRAKWINVYEFAKQTSRIERNESKCIIQKWQLLNGTQIVSWRQCYLIFLNNSFFSTQLFFIFFHLVCNSISFPIVLLPYFHYLLLAVVFRCEPSARLFGKHNYGSVFGRRSKTRRDEQVWAYVALPAGSTKPLVSAREMALSLRPHRLICLGHHLVRREFKNQMHL